MRGSAPGDRYQADVEPLLPASASTFFSFHSAADPSVTTKLQHALNAKANEHTVAAAVQHMKEQSRRGDRWGWAHHKTITARGAWDWKVTRPEDPHLRLSDVEYAIAARLHLDLRPLPARSMAVLPEHCTQCRHRVTGAPVSLRNEPWHWLSCANTARGEVSRRHNAVADAVARVAWLVGAQVRREVTGLDPNSGQVGCFCRTCRCPLRSRRAEWR